jgi:predicted Zn-dependent protease
MPGRRQLFDVGGVLWQVGRRDEAERLVGEIVQLHPNYVPSRLTLGGLLLDARRPAAALEQFRAASALEPGNGLAWFGMAQAASALGRAEDARAYADRARSAGVQ